MKLIFLFFVYLSSSAFAQTLPPNAPERQQLIAMGAEFLPEGNDDKFTFFKLDKNLFFVTKSAERTAVGRNFIRDKKLNQTEELELHKLVNKMNLDNPVQFVLFEKSLQANIFIFGNHEPKVFARIVFAASKIESVFETNPKIYSLINN
jgi:hypothetical protein